MLRKRSETVRKRSETVKIKQRKRATKVRNSSTSQQWAHNSKQIAYSPVTVDDAFRQLQPIDPAHMKLLKELEADWQTGDPLNGTDHRMMSSRLQNELVSVKEAGLPDTAHVYGEVNHTHGLALLLEFKKQGFQPGKKFVDLGSGTGKMVGVAWLCGLNAVGVEFSKARYDKSCRAIERLPTQKSVGTLQFLHGNFLKYDFSDADVIFTNSIMFSDEVLS